jgi:hypothetical protein
VATLLSAPSKSLRCNRQPTISPGGGTKRHSLSSKDHDAGIVAQAFPASCSEENVMQRRNPIVQETRKSISDPYDVEYFAKKHGISSKDASRIINLHRSDRDSSDRAAYQLKNSL